MLVVADEPAPAWPDDLAGLVVVRSTSGASRSIEDSLLLLLGIVISSAGSSCVDGPPIAFGAANRDALLLLV